MHVAATEGGDGDGFEAAPDAAGGREVAVGVDVEEIDFGQLQFRPCLLRLGRSPDLPG